MISLQNTILRTLFVPLIVGTLLFPATTPLAAKGAGAYCGTYPQKALEELFVHRQNLQLKELRQQLSRLNGFAVTEEPKGATEDRGDIAILEEDAGIVSRRNPFTLSQRTLRFVPEGEGYRAENIEGNYSNAESDNGANAGLVDDSTREYPLAFPFAYYGAARTSVWVNSDGNLTFGAGDASTRERSLGRLLSGLPRIGGYFTDLDVTSGGTIRVLSTPERFVVSWAGVPEFTEFGIGRLVTFQIRLLASGAIEFAYGQVNVPSGITGLAPGELRNASRIVSFAALEANAVYNGAVAERFTNVEEIDTVTAAQRFYETHDDAYDFVAIYNALGIPASEGGVIAFEVTVRNNRTGYGDFLVEAGREYGSARRLQAVLNMGPTSQYPTNPNTILVQRFSARDTPTTVLAHEAGHLFLAFASVPDPLDPRQPAILGRQSAHWSFTFNSEASLLEGNRILDRGPNTVPRFETVAVTEQYSPLDQYLMGFRAKEEVGPLFFVTGSGISNLFPPPPAVGRTFEGERRDFTVEDLIAVHGRRTPDHTVSQRKFRMGVVVIAPRGMAISEEVLAQVEGYRKSFEEFYGRAAGGRSTMEATLRRKLEWSVFPAAGVLAGSTGTAILRIEKPLTTALDVTLSSDSANLRVPATTSIPAGATSVTIPLEGLTPGLATLRAQPSDSAFTEAEARIQVNSGAGNLAIGVVAGNNQRATGGVLPQPIVVRVADINRLPYPGLRIVAQAAGNGVVEPATALIGEDGTASFRWTPAESPANRVLFSVQGIPATQLSAQAVTEALPTLRSNTVVNAASFAAGLTSGSLHTIFGANLARNLVVAPFPWPTTLNGVTVRVNGEAQPLVFVSEGQINFFLQSSITGDTAQVEVETNVGRGAAVPVAVRRLAPGIFFNPGNGEGAILRQANVLEVFATGLGPTTESGGLSRTVEPVQAFWNGAERPVLFSGLAPGFVGLYQINVEIPAGAGGTNRLRLVIGGVASNEVTVTLAP